MRRKQDEQALSAVNLKNTLWDTLNMVRQGELDPSQANSVACQARQILGTVKMQLQIAAQTARSVPAEIITFSEGA